MPFIKEIFKKDFELCFELDSNTIALWNKKQWESELNKNGVKGFAISTAFELVGVCVFQVVIDEAQLNYFSISQNFRRKGNGSHLMHFLIKKCEELNLKKISLEVSESNLAANRFYECFNFINVGDRKNYYRNGDKAFLKEKFL